jgi:uncharacterized protein YciI
LDGSERGQSAALTWQRPAGRLGPVIEWIYFIHPPRENFAATMTAEEKAVWAEHFTRLQGLLADGQLILAGPTLGPTNTGISIFEAADEEAAQKFMAEDPVILSGFARGELRPFRVSLLRGRD